MNNGNRNLGNFLYSNSLKNFSGFYQSPQYQTCFNYINTINSKNSKFSNIIKLTKKYINKNSKKKILDSFHKSIIHRKLFSNPKYIEIEKRIYNTDIRSKESTSTDKISTKNNIKNQIKKNLF